MASASRSPRPREPVRRGENGDYEQRLADFGRRPNPLWLVLCLSLVAGLVITGLASLALGVLGAAGWSEFPLPDPQDHRGRATLCLIAYLALFAGVWGTYFLSLTFPGLHIRSLRVLLDQQSWSLQYPEARGTRAQAQTEKAGRTITMLAMLIPACVLLLVQGNGIYQNDAAMQEVGLAGVGELILSVGMLAIVSALVCFIVSVDSLDSSFNQFHASVADRLTAHFYRQTINPKYVGFMLLLLGAVLFIAFHSRIMGCLAIGLIIGIGYPHWFPCIGARPSVLSRLLTVARFAVLLSPPLFVLALAGA